MTKKITNKPKKLWLVLSTEEDRIIKHCQTKEDALEFVVHDCCDPISDYRIYEAIEYKIKAELEVAND